MKRRVSSHDVARRAGVSQSTVSLVLNGRTDVRISDQTRQRVMEAAQQLNYSRNASAHALATGRTNRIGVVPFQPFNFLNHNPYYSHILAGIMEGSLRWGMNLLLHSVHYPDPSALLADILSGSADGVLLIGREITDPITPALLEAQFPTVCLNYRSMQAPCYAVDCDNEQGAYLAFRHLLALGHRNIVVFYPGDTTSWSLERRLGAERAVAEFGNGEARLTYSHLAHRYRNHPDSTETLIGYLQGLSPRPTALFFTEETLAQRFIEDLPVCGLRSPEDLAVVCFDSTEASTRTRPPLTSVHQPLAAIGEGAVDLLMELIQGKEVAPGVRRYPVRLDIRESCGAMLRCIP